MRFHKGKAENNGDRVEWELSEQFTIAVNSSLDFEKPQNQSKTLSRNVSFQNRFQTRLLWYRLFLAFGTLSWAMSMFSAKLRLSRINFFFFQCRNWNVATSIENWGVFCRATAELAFHCSILQNNYSVCVKNLSISTFLRFNESVQIAFKNFIAALTSFARYGVM